MIPIKTNEERMRRVLPQHIIESDALSGNAKKVLAALINYYLTLDIVRDSGYVLSSNANLRASAGINMNELLGSVQELIELGLVRREAGKKRIKSEKAIASKYFINWDNVKNPIKKKTFEELFAEIIKPSETSINTVVADAANTSTIASANTSTIASANANTSTIASANTSDIVNDMLCNVIEKEKNILKKEKEKEELDESKVNLEQEEAFAEGKFYTREEQRLAREKDDVHQYIDQQSYGMSFQDFDDKFNLKIRDYVSSKYPRDTRELFLDAMKRIVAIKSSRNEVIPKI